MDRDHRAVRAAVLSGGVGGALLSPAKEYLAQFALAGRLDGALGMGAAARRGRRDPAGRPVARRGGARLLPAAESE